MFPVLLGHTDVHKPTVTYLTLTLTLYTLLNASESFGDICTVDADPILPVVTPLLSLCVRCFHIFHIESKLYKCSNGV